MGKTLKRGVTLLLAAMMVLSLMPTVGWAESEGRTLYFNGTSLYTNSECTDQYTGSNWSVEGSTLKLSDGFKFETTAAKALVIKADATIDVTGTATIKATNAGNEQQTFGIYAEKSKSLTITGSGTLNVYAGDITNTADTYIAQSFAIGNEHNNSMPVEIYEDSNRGDLTVTGGVTVETIGGDLNLKKISDSDPVSFMLFRRLVASRGVSWENGSVSVKNDSTLSAEGGKITATDNTLYAQSCGVSVRFGNFICDGQDTQVDAYGGECCGNSAGLMANEMDISGSSGKVYIPEYDEDTDTYTYKIKVTNGAELNCTGGVGAQAGNQCGSFGCYGFGASIDVSSDLEGYYSVITATGADNVQHESVGIADAYANITVNVGGVINATGGDCYWVSDISNSVKDKDGKIVKEYQTCMSYGIDAGCDLIVYEGARINASCGKLSGLKDYSLLNLGQGVAGVRVYKEETDTPEDFGPGTRRESNGTLHFIYTSDDAEVSDVFNCEGGVLAEKFMTVKGNTLLAGATNTATAVISRAGDATSASSGISLMLDAKATVGLAEATDEETKLTTTEVTKADGLTVLKGFDINVGTESDPDKYGESFGGGQVNVRFYVPNLPTGTKLYWLKDNGKYEEVSYTYENGYVEFFTTHFSKFVLGKPTVNTGDSSDIALFGIMGILALAGAGFVYKRREN